MGGASDEITRGAASDRGNGPSTLWCAMTMRSNRTIAVWRDRTREAQERLAIRIVRNESSCLQHHDGRAHPHPAVKIDHILIGHSYAARGNRTSDVFGLIGPVDAIQRVLPAGVKVECACAHWIARAACDVARKRAKPPLLVRGRRPSRPFLLTANGGHARPGLSSLAHGRTVANRLASRQHVVNERTIGLDQDRAWHFSSVVLNNLALIGRRK